MGNVTLITSAQARARLDMPRSTFHRRVSQGCIPVAYQLPGRRGACLFDPEVIDSLKEQADHE